MQHFSADAIMFFNFFEIFYLPTKVEKTTLKTCSEKLKSNFSLLPWAAQTAQKEEFMFQIVAYRPTVYRTGLKSIGGTEFFPLYFVLLPEVVCV